MTPEIKLASLGCTRLVSRAQASGLLNKVKSAEAVIFDFSEIRWISQSFCTELFKLAAERSPKLYIECTNTSKSVQQSLESYL